MDKIMKSLLSITALSLAAFNANAGCPLSAAKIQSLFMKGVAVKPLVDLQKYKIDHCRMNIFGGIASTNIKLPNQITDYHIYTEVSAGFDFKSTPSLPLMIDTTIDVGYVNYIKAPWIVMSNSIINGRTGISNLNFAHANIRNSGIGCWNVAGCVIDNINLNSANVFNIGINGTVINPFDIRGAALVSSHTAGIATPGATNQLLMDKKTKIYDHTFHGDMSGVDRLKFASIGVFCKIKVVDTYIMQYDVKTKKTRKINLTRASYPSDHHCPKSPMMAQLMLTPAQ